MLENLQLLRKQAETAVEDMPDSEMKLKAFEVILAHLLNGDSGGQGSKASVRSDDSKPRATKVAAVPRTSGDRIVFLHSEGFFVSQRSLSDVQGELRKNGWHYPVTALSGPLQKLVQKRLLRREQAKDGNRTIWKYSNF